MSMTIKKIIQLNGSKKMSAIIMKIIAQSKSFIMIFYSCLVCHLDGDLKIQIFETEF